MGKNNSNKDDTKIGLFIVIILFLVGFLLAIYLLATMFLLPKENKTNIKSDNESMIADDNHQIEYIEERFYDNYALDRAEMGLNGLDGLGGVKNEDMAYGLYYVKHMSDNIDLNNIDFSKSNEVYGDYDYDMLQQEVDGLTDEEMELYDYAVECALVGSADKVKERHNQEKILDIRDYWISYMNNLRDTVYGYGFQDDQMKIVDYDTFYNIWGYYCSQEWNNFDFDSEDTKKAILNETFTTADIDNIKFHTPYTDKTKNYAIMIKKAQMGVISYYVNSCYIDDDRKLNMQVEYEGGATGDHGCGAIIVVPVDKDIEVGCIDVKWSYADDPYSAPSGKPVVYLYGYDEDVSVKLDDKIDFLFTYPKYDKIWNVNAKPDGTLTDKSGREYKYLFWEGYENVDWDMSKGFCVKNTDLVEFLEDKLVILGLNDNEANDFITYWVPKMQDNEYNLITFQVEDYEKMLPIEVDPKPDTSIRFLMTWRGLDKFVSIDEQELIPVERSGKTVIEWGGREMY